MRGIVGEIRIRAAFGEGVTQTLALGERTGNRWVAWRALQPRDPLLWGEVLAIHEDGTRTVEYPWGGTQRVRGTATVGASVWVRGGRIEGEAPALPAYEIVL